jgi:PLP dependent protein
MITQNLALVQERIEKAAKRAGRNPSEIRLISVTKTANIAQLKEAISAGMSDIGENRVGDALLKYNALGELAKSIKWHMIGHLQANKVKKCLGIFDIIHSLDSIGLAGEIDKQAKAIGSPFGEAKGSPLGEAKGRRVDCLIEVNVSGEASKYGIKPDSVYGFVKETTCFSNINIIGLMAMAPIVKDPEDTRPYFKKLRFLRDNLNQSGLEYTDIKELSMGMTQDFEVAVEEGATFIRVGTAIFKN